ncbi:MAG: hypothetical protein RLZZ06_390, partial [Actinomycetota bacterium]
KVVAEAVAVSVADAQAEAVVASAEVVLAEVTVRVTDVALRTAATAEVAVPEILATNRFTLGIPQVLCLGDFCLHFGLAIVYHCKIDELRRCFLYSVKNSQ